MEATPMRAEARRHVRLVGLEVIDEVAYERYRRGTQPRALKQAEARHPRVSGKQAQSAPGGIR
jgi:hypothetical protein